MVLEAQWLQNILLNIFKTQIIPPPSHILAEDTHTHLSQTAQLSQ